MRLAVLGGRARVHEHRAVVGVWMHGGGDSAGLGVERGHGARTLGSAGVDDSGALLLEAGVRGGGWPCLLAGGHARVGGEEGAGGMVVLGRHAKEFRKPIDHVSTLILIHWLCLYGGHCSTHKHTHKCTKTHTHTHTLIE